MKKLIEFVGLFLLGALIGWYAHKYTSQPGEVTIIIPDSLINNENDKIDSLQTIIEEIEKNRETLKDSIVYITNWKIKEVSKVKTLPLDSGIIYLRKKLREYED